MGLSSNAVARAIGVTMKARETRALIGERVTPLPLAFFELCLLCHSPHDSREHRTPIGQPFDAVDVHYVPAAPAQ